MTALPVESRADVQQPFDPQQSLDRLRLRLVDAAADLRPLPSLDDMAERIHAVASELEAIVRELPLVIHVSQLEARGLRDTLDELDKQLANGWVPEASPVEDVVARLRSSLNTPKASDDAG